MGSDRLEGEMTQRGKRRQDGTRRANTHALYHANQHSSMAMVLRCRCHAQCVRFAAAGRTFLVSGRSPLPLVLRRLTKTLMRCCGEDRWGTEACELMHALKPRHTHFFAP